MKSVKPGSCIYGVNGYLHHDFHRWLLIAAEKEQVIQITAKRFEYSPKEITVKKGVPVVLEFTSLDRLHGFDCPGLEIRTDIRPGKVIQVRFVPHKVGTFPFSL